MGSDYWSGLLDWARDAVVGRGMISAHDLDLVHLCDDPADAVEYVCARGAELRAEELEATEELARSQAGDAS